MVLCVTLSNPQRNYTPKNKAHCKFEDYFQLEYNQSLLIVDLIAAP